MLRRTLTTILAAAAALLAAAAPASAERAKPNAKFAKFTATFEASYTTKWGFEKRRTGGSACGGYNYSRGDGEEVWTIKTRKANKLLAYSTGYGAGFYHGTWDHRFEEGDNFEAKGRHTRSGGTIVTREPGPCGGDYHVQENPDDCGTRLPEYELRIDGVSKVYPNLMKAPWQRNEKVGFEDCELRQAEGLVAGHWPRVEGKVPVKALFNRRRKVVEITGRKSWDNAGEPTASSHQTASEMEWKFTLTRKK